MEKSVMKKRLLSRYMIAYFIMIICMISLKIFSCCLPANPIRQNIARSAGKMQEEGISPRNIYSQIPYDNATDAEILSVCWSSVGQKDKLIAAVDNIEYSFSGDTDAVSWLCNLVKNGQNGRVIHVVRHWMGITVPLKILFIFFDYSQIRLIVMIMLFGMSFEIMRMTYKYDKCLSVAFFISLFAIDILSAFLTVNSWSVVAVTLSALIYYIKKKDTATFDKGLFLFVLGGATCFLDLMSAPIMTYLYNVVFMLILSKDRVSLKQKCSFLIRTGVYWLTGYVSVWMVQWGLSSIVLHENIYLNAVTEMLRMVDGKILEWLPESKIDRIFAAIGLNKGLLLTSYFINFKLMMAVLMLIAVLFWAVRKDKEKLYTYSMLVIVGIIPFGWFVVANNQSLVFYNLSFRILGGTVMVAVYLLCQCYAEIREKNMGLFRLHKSKF